MASTTEDQPNALDADAKNTSSCLNDPNFGIICVFLQKFATQLKIEHPDFLQLQQMIENTNEVHQDLKTLLVKLLRKTRKSVQPDKLDTALMKFCFSYAAQDAWEIERFGYQGANLTVKIRLIKELLECQFEKNPQFRTIIATQTATDLRSQPLGKDKLGNMYWSTLDEKCNLRIYQEHLDEEIWKVVATSRDELVNLIACLKGNKLVMPSLVGLVDEDSSSNSMSAKADALNGVAIKAEHKTEADSEPVKSDGSLNIKIKLKTPNGEAAVTGVKLENVKTEDAQSGHATEETEAPSSKRLSLLASKKSSQSFKAARPSPNKELLRKRPLDVDIDTETSQKKRPSLLSAKHKQSKYANVSEAEDDDGKDSFDEDDENDEDEEDEEEVEEEEEEEDCSSISSADIGKEIEEPVMYVRGEGSGKQNKTGNFLNAIDVNYCEDSDVGEAIEEEVMLFCGVGSGHECTVGNNDPKSSEEAAAKEIKQTTTTEPTAMFFFGQPGCLKLSPMKSSAPSKPIIDNTTTDKVNSENVPSSEIDSSHPTTSSIARQENKSLETKCGLSIEEKGAHDSKNVQTNQTIENDALECKTTENPVVNDTHSPANALNSQCTIVNAIPTNEDEVDKSINTKSHNETLLKTNENNEITSPDANNEKLPSTISILAPESVLYEKTEEHHEEAIDSVLNTAAECENTDETPLTSNPHVRESNEPIPVESTSSDPTISSIKGNEIFENAKQEIIVNEIQPPSDVDQTNCEPLLSEPLATKIGLELTHTDAQSSTTMTSNDNPQSPSNNFNDHGKEAISLTTDLPEAVDEQPPGEHETDSSVSDDQINITVASDTNAESSINKVVVPTDESGINNPIEEQTINTTTAHTSGDDSIDKSSVENLVSEQQISENPSNETSVENSLDDQTAIDETSADNPIVAQAGDNAVDNVRIDSTAVEPIVTNTLDDSSAENPIVAQAGDNAVDEIGLHNPIVQPTADTSGDDSSADNPIVTHAGDNAVDKIGLDNQPTAAADTLQDKPSSDNVIDSQVGANSVREKRLDNLIEYQAIDNRINETIGTNPIGDVAENTVNQILVPESYTVKSLDLIAAYSDSSESSENVSEGEFSCETASKEDTKISIELPQDPVIAEDQPSISNAITKTIDANKSTPVKSISVTELEEKVDNYFDNILEEASDKTLKSSNLHEEPEFKDGEVSSNATTAEKCKNESTIGTENDHSVIATTDAEENDHISKTSFECPKDSNIGNEATASNVISESILGNIHPNETFTDDACASAVVPIINASAADDLAGSELVHELTNYESTPNESLVSKYTINEQQTDDPITNEPQHPIDHSVVDEPIANQFTANKPCVEGNVVEESPITESVIEGPTVNESTSNETNIIEPVVEEPIAHEPAEQPIELENNDVLVTSPLVSNSPSHDTPVFTKPQEVDLIEDDLKNDPTELETTNAGLLSETPIDEPVVEKSVREQTPVIVLLEGKNESSDRSNELCNLKETEIDVNAKPDLLTEVIEQISSHPISKSVKELESNENITTNADSVRIPDIVGTNSGEKFNSEEPINTITADNTTVSQIEKHTISEVVPSAEMNSSVETIRPHTSKSIDLSHTTGTTEIEILNSVPSKNTDIVPNKNDLKSIESAKVLQSQGHYTDEREVKIVINHEKRKASELDQLEDKESKKICEEGEISSKRYLNAMENISSYQILSEKHSTSSEETVAEKITLNTLSADSTHQNDVSQKVPNVDQSLVSSDINTIKSSNIFSSYANSIPSSEKLFEIEPKSSVSKELSVADPQNAVTVAQVVSEHPEQVKCDIQSAGDFTSTEKENDFFSQSNRDVKSKVAPENASQRNRKRRLSGEKVRLSSESDGDFFNDSPSMNISDGNSDENIGGKRLKMRAKVPMKNSRLRKAAEQKRVFDPEQSTDEDSRSSVSEATPKEQQPLSPSKGLLTSELTTRNRTQTPLTVQQPAIEQLKSISAEIDAAAPSPDETQIELSTAPSDDTESSNYLANNDQSDTSPHTEDVAETKTRRPGRPAKKSVTNQQATKRAATSKPIESEESQSTPVQPTETVEVKPPPKSEPRKKRRSLLGLDISETAIIPTNMGDTPVRQSRRIAQLKIKEEAERRKEEEIALKKLKDASEKKKKGIEKAKSDSDYSQEEEDEEHSEAEVEFKEGRKKKRKSNKNKPWQTDSSDSSERDEEDLDDHDEHEHRLPPLKSDHEFSPESDIEDETQVVPLKRARTARKDQAEIDADEDDHACQKCSKNDHPEWILLCDKCDKGYHCSCLIPVLFIIPEGDWFCPPCQQEKLIEELESKLVEYDALVKKREVEEAERQYILNAAITEANELLAAKRDKRKAERKAQRKARRSRSNDETGSSSDDDDNDDDDDDDDEPHIRRNTNRSISESSATNSSDDEPIYKLRKRRQTNVSYRFNEYDEMINRAIKSEMDEVAGAGNLGRGKDISTIIDADKEGKRRQQLSDDGDDQDEEVKPKQPVSKGKHLDSSSEDSDSEPIRRPSKLSGSRKKKKLNSLDVDSDDEGSDEDFKTSSYSDEEDEEENLSASSCSESSLEAYGRRRKGRNSSRRPVRERRKRFDADFIDDNSDDGSDNIPLIKKKKKIESDFSDFNESSDEDDEENEELDSEDLCDDSTDDSDSDWRKKKSRKKQKPPSKPSISSAPKSSQPKKKVKRKEEGEKSYRAGGIKGKTALESDDDDEVLPKSRRTRGKKLSYLLEEELESSDDGIKPGVKRPDTPPEERAAFIQKQEEIKRMLAAKNTEGANALAAPTIASIPTPEKMRRAPPKDSLSTIPLQVIQAAKALDVDLKKTAVVNRGVSDNDSDGFDDDLPEDFDPEEMDEDEIAKMMEEEDFAQHQLKLAGEAIRNKKLKEEFGKRKDTFLTKMPPELDPRLNPVPIIMPSNQGPPTVVLQPPLAVHPSLVGLPSSIPMYPSPNQAPITVGKTGTTPKKRGRKVKDELLVDPPKTARPIDGLRAPGDHSGHLPPMYLPHGAPMHPSHLPPHPSAQHLSQGPPHSHSLPHTQGLPIPPSALHHVSQASINPHTASVISHSSMLQQRPLPLTSHAPPSHGPSTSILGISHSQEPIIPTTVLAVQNTRLLDPAELGQPPENLLESPSKKRGRRKKFTPLRESLNSPPIAGPPGGMDLSSASPTSAASVEPPKSSILSERLGAIPDNKRGLSVASPAQLYSPPTASQPSVITRLPRPPHGPPFSQSQPQPQQRYYPQGHGLPPHSISSSHSRPAYHPPNVVVSSGHRPPPLVNQPTGAGHLPHPMYMRGQPMYGAPGYPPGPPPPMHRSLQAMEAAANSPQDYSSSPYHSSPYGSFYAHPSAPPPGHGTSLERRAMVNTFEQYDNIAKSSPSPHDRSTPNAYHSHGPHHPGVVTAIPAGSRHPDDDDERSTSSAGAGSLSGAAETHSSNAATGTGSTSEFSGLVSYFSSQQDDLDS